MKLTHDIPKCQGVANAIKRAYTLTDCKWYGLKAIPSSGLIVRNPGIASASQDTFVPAYVPQTGLLYSAGLKEESYIGTTVPLETFATALQNPNSVLYTQTLHLAGGAAGCYYGMVCSAFVSYALDLPYRVNCREFDTYPGITKLENFTVDDLQLCDILDRFQDAATHIVLITDIVRDETGRVHTIEISECTPSNCVRRPFTRQQFVQWFFDINGYSFYRMEDFSHVKYEVNPYLHTPEEEVEEPAKFCLMTDKGHNASYLLHEEPVSLTLLEGDWDEFVVTAPTGTKTYKAGSKVKVDCPTVGHYSAVCRKGDAVSAPVCWHVHQIRLRTDKLVYKVGEPITLTYENAEEDEVFLSRLNILPKNSCRAWQYLSGTKGTVTYPGLTTPGNYWGFAMAKNETCCYISEKAWFEVVE